MLPSIKKYYCYYYYYYYYYYYGGKKEWGVRGGHTGGEVACLCRMPHSFLETNYHARFSANEDIVLYSLGSAWWILVKGW